MPKITHIAQLDLNKTYSYANYVTWRLNEAVELINGAPDWIIEILSKGNSKREMQIKYQLYQEAGVAEYWIVYPNDQAINQFVLDDNGRYQLKAMYADDDIATPHLFPDLAIELTEVFATWSDES
jgi:Uma2 family endonuclease